MDFGELVPDSDREFRSLLGSRWARGAQSFGLLLDPERPWKDGIPDLPSIFSGSLGPSSLEPFSEPGLDFFLGS